MKQIRCAANLAEGLWIDLQRFSRLHHEGKRKKKELMYAIRKNVSKRWEIRKGESYGRLGRGDAGGPSFALGKVVVLALYQGKVHCSRSRKYGDV